MQFYGAGFFILFFQKNKESFLLKIRILRSNKRGLWSTNSIIFQEQNKLSYGKKENFFLKLFIESVV
jgi:hypothetical protein